MIKAMMVLGKPEMLWEVCPTWSDMLSCDKTPPRLVPIACSSSLTVHVPLWTAGGPPHQGDSIPILVSIKKGLAQPAFPHPSQSRPTSENRTSMTLPLACKEGSLGAGWARALWFALSTKGRTSAVPHLFMYLLCVHVYVCVDKRGSVELRDD